MYHIFGSRLLFWLSNLKNPRLKVRVLIIWRVIILGLIIWMYSTGLGMYPRFYCGPQGDPHLDCCLDHCRVYPEPIDSTKNSSTRCRLFAKWSSYLFASTLYRSQCNILIIREAVLIWRLSGAGWQVSQHVYKHIFCMILSSQPTWP